MSNIDGQTCPSNMHTTTAFLLSHNHCRSFFSIFTRSMQFSCRHLSSTSFVTTTTIRRFTDKPVHFSQDLLSTLFKKFLHLRYSNAQQKETLSYISRLNINHYKETIISDQNDLTNIFRRHFRKTSTYTVVQCATRNSK